MTGTVFDIQRYNIHDGPGIRTIAFLQGCPLGCLWCCNPESQAFQKTNATQWRCGKEYTVEALAKELMKDEVFFRKSGGGVTLSGGEALVQAEFCLALADTLAAHGITTVLETSGQCNGRDLLRMAEKCCLVLFDLKEMDTNKHREFTGVGNERILQNARDLLAAGAAVQFRMPVIPGYNDRRENFDLLIDFLREIGYAQDLRLLPYHRLGENKYAAAGLPYALEEVKPPTDEQMETIRRVFLSAGIRAEIGG